MKKIVCFIWVIILVACRNRDVIHDGSKQHYLFNDISIYTPDEYIPIDSGKYNSDNLQDAKQFYLLKEIDYDNFITISKKKSEQETYDIPNLLKTKIGLLKEIISDIEIKREEIIKINEIEFGLIEYYDMGAQVMHKYEVFTSRNKFDYEFNFNLQEKTSAKVDKKIIDCIYSIKIK